MVTGRFVVLFLFGATAAYAQSGRPVTFTKDVAPIFQDKCEACHRPDSIAPMSLITFEEARPWARSIKARVAARQMPPWHIDKTVGIQKFKNDRSLSDEQIDTIVRWVDAGAPQGRSEGHAAAEDSGPTTAAGTSPSSSADRPTCHQVAAVHDAGAAQDAW